MEAFKVEQRGLMTGFFKKVNSFDTVNFLKDEPFLFSNL